MSTANTALNTPLPKPLRTQLENTVKAARDVAENAGKAALTQLAVSEAKAPDYLSADQKALRRSLRSHGRALGDAKLNDETQELQHLVWEVAYELWHRMLFARFLAENNLLMWEPGAAVSLDDCRDMVDNHPDMSMGAKSHWELASKLAARMLPQVFKPQSPVFELTFAPENQRELERLLANLPTEVFLASDSLGWVYQFWQSKRKDEVNASEVKIGADELPAVTQLFTESYMVDFLLHNSLGAWWHTRHPGEPCPVAMPYLRTLEDGSPAAGKFEGWPDKLTEFKLLDPSCGSGHFLVAAFLLLVPLRIADEGLTAQDAVDFVLQDNLRGLELDPRCVEIAVFATALAAWRYPDENGNPLGVRADMPAPSIACCGLPVAGSTRDWRALVPDDHAQVHSLREGLTRLHSTFAQAPLLGSLLDPAKANKGDLFSADYTNLGGLLRMALAAEKVPSHSDDNEGAWEMALSAQGLMAAAQLLESQYHLVITNVPYLTRGKQDQALRDYCEAHYSSAKNDLANVFLERCLELSLPGSGVVQIVMPQNWLFLTSYKKQREELLNRVRWDLLARLGPGAFETISGEVVQAVLLTQTNTKPNARSRLHGLDASAPRTAQGKAECLGHSDVKAVSQMGQLENPDAIVAFELVDSSSLMQAKARAWQGLVTADDNRYVIRHWEVSSFTEIWMPMQQAPMTQHYYTGKTDLIRWEQGKGSLHASKTAHNFPPKSVIGKRGIAIQRMRALNVTLYDGHPFDDSVSPLIPVMEDLLPALWCYTHSEEYVEEVRRLNQSVKVVPGSLTKVKFDETRWREVASERYPHGLPKPYSDDPTQWLFHGHPQTATDPLQVAVARLLGYIWPAEASSSMELSNEAHTWVANSQLLARHVDDDGIVCLQSVRGEAPAHERLLTLLIDAWETVTPGSWTPSILDKLLAQVDCAGKGLAVWLREQFFEQHAKRFQHRPFIWHVWDGQKDGFGALVNAHKLDAKNLERLIHTYLGDWIRTQEAGVVTGVDGAPLRLSAAQNLKGKLQAIQDGEAPYDIFVRWKSLTEQPIGWNPDLNDGVRMNIRPFVTAEVLRHNRKPKLNIAWEKDRGKESESAPWFGVFGGERINDHHLTLAEKIAARRKKGDL